MLDRWALFGTGKMMPFYRGLLTYIGGSVICYFDNNEDKWGTKIDGIRIESPEIAKTLDVPILISTSAEKEIESQLLEMEIDRELIFDYSKLLQLYVDCFSNDDEKIFEEKKAINKQNIIVDAYDGVGYGGLELWSYQVSDEFNRRGYLSSVIGSEGQVIPDEWANTVRYFSFDKDIVGKSWDSIKPIAEYMEKHLPFTLINNWSDHVLAASLIVKKKYPQMVHILSVVHFDAEFMYRKVQAFENEVDGILCVSKKINDTLKSDYGIAEDKLFYHCNFISKNSKCNDNVLNSGGRIQIGWAARLETEQKRADLIPRLVELLDECNLCYDLNIAGEGSYRRYLDDWIYENEKGDHIRLLGQISKEKMADFWEKQNIYINLSDYEGVSLAMLEAMSSGVVPVVTDVSGVRDVLEDIEPKLISNVGDIDGVAKIIIMLAYDEEKRRQYSKQCQGFAIKQCGFNTYMDDMERLIERIREC